MGRLARAERTSRQLKVLLFYLLIVYHLLRLFFIDCKWPFTTTSDKFNERKRGTETKGIFPRVVCKEIGCSSKRVRGFEGLF